MPRTYNEVDARVTRLMKELENLKKELASKQGLLEEGDGIELTPDAETNKTTVSVDENVVALKADFGANPVLSGNEPILEGLKLLGTDYKVGDGGDLYLHLIQIKGNSQGFNTSLISVAIYSPNQEAFTAQTLKEFVVGIGSNDNYGLPVAIKPTDTTTNIYVNGHLSTNLNILSISCQEITLVNNALSYNEINKYLAIQNFTDTVTKL